MSVWLKTNSIWLNKKLSNKMQWIVFLFKTGNEVTCNLIITQILTVWQQTIQMI